MLLWPNELATIWYFRQACINICICISLRFMMVTTWTSLWLGHFVELLSLLPSYQVETFWLFTLSLMARCRGEASILPTEKYHVRNILILHCIQSHIFTWRDMRQYFTYKIHLPSFLFYPSQSSMDAALRSLHTCSYTWIRGYKNVICYILLCHRHSWVEDMSVRSCWFLDFHKISGKQCQLDLQAKRLQPSWTHIAGHEMFWSLCEKIHIFSSSSSEKLILGQQNTTNNMFLVFCNFYFSRWILKCYTLYIYWKCVGFCIICCFGKTSVAQNTAIRKAVTIARKLLGFALALCVEQGN